MFSAVSGSGVNPITVRIRRLQSEFLERPQSEPMSYSQLFCSSKVIQVRFYYNIHVLFVIYQRMFVLNFTFFATNPRFVSTRY